MPHVQLAICSCPACQQGLEPFTVEHFRVWAYELILDNTRHWILNQAQEEYAADLFTFTREEIPAECWWVVPEGNGKTTTVAGLALYYLEHTPLASIPVAASARDQTKPIYLQMEGFITRTDRLHAMVDNVYDQTKGKKSRDVPRFEAQEGFRRIKYHRGGEIQIYAADEGTADGVIPRGISITDELHRHRTLRLYRLWVGKGEKNGACTVAISTAGEPGSDFEEQRAEMRLGDVVERDGCHTRALSETAVIHEWAVPTDGDVEDLELVCSANPLLSMTKIQRKRKAKSWTLAHWRRFTCNLATRSNNAAITEVEWANAKSDLPFPYSEPHWLGLDIGWKVDCTALVPLWVPSRALRLFGPATILEPRADGESIDVLDIKAIIHEASQAGPIVAVVMDTTRAMDIAQWIGSELGLEVIDRTQSNPMSALDYERWMEAMRSGQLKHSGDANLTHHVLNAVAQTLSPTQTKFDRAARARYRKADEEDTRQRARWIDALVAASMVHTVATAEFYEEAKKSQEPLVAWGW